MVELPDLRVIKLVRQVEGCPARQAIEMGKLLAILAVLVEHFKSEVEQDLQHGVPV